jgi:hypothetical protein
MLNGDKTKENKLYFYPYKLILMTLNIESIAGREFVVAQGELVCCKDDLVWKLKHTDLDVFPKEAFLRRGLPKLGFVRLSFGASLESMAGQLCVD